MGRTAQPGLQDLALARQPILDRQRGLVGYELLFRHAGDGAAQFHDGVSATAHVVNNAFAEMGLSDVIGHQLGFVNVDAAFLFSEFVLLLPPGRVVIELLETVDPGPEIVARCLELKSMGYRIALDDFDGSRDDMGPLVEIADIIKVDLTLVSDARLRALVAELHRPGLTLLAEKVETAAQFERCLRLGFHLFQGYHFAKPQTLSARRPGHRKMALLHLLTLIARDATPVQLEAAFKHHPDLSVNLLRLVNSAAMGIQGRISSMRHAVVMLGQRRLHAWLQLLVYTAGNARQAVPLLQMASVRGRLLEQMAQAQRPWDADYHDQAFLTGAFSLMDTMLGMPMSHIVDRIHAAPDVRDALLQQTGSLGALLTLAHQLERDDRPAVEHSLRALPDAIRTSLSAFQLEAYQWSNALSWAVASVQADDVVAPIDPPPPERMPACH